MTKNDVRDVMREAFNSRVFKKLRGREAASEVTCIHRVHLNEGCLLCERGFLRHLRKQTNLEELRRLKRRIRRMKNTFKKVQR